MPTLVTWQRKGEPLAIYGYDNSAVSPRGNGIPEGATVVTVADAFDAMTHDRPYRASQPVDEAIKEIVRHAGKQFNPAVVDALERLYRRNELPVTQLDASVADAA
ncbi:MAG: hypothetical protein IIB88_08430 [Chloroflexi bacterium]|nr:hypothetical protein [Chloroflexota bacterium]